MDYFTIPPRCQDYAGPYRCERPAGHMASHLHTQWDPEHAPRPWDAKVQDGVWPDHGDSCRCQACK